MKFSRILCGLYVLFLFGCSQPPSNEKSLEKDVGSLEQKETKTDYVPFYVYLNKGSRENHYIPSGFMPNGNCIEFNDAWLQNCHSLKTCMKVSYDVECSRKDQNWGGIYWLYPANNWGNKKGGFDLTGASKLTFWAKGLEGGEQIQEFTVGGISGNYPDSDTAVIGPVILSDQWKQYSIDLRGKDLKSISGGFAWTTSEDVNPETCVFFLDDIKFE
ncbi:hypothetical protein MNBD_BACTEROID05-990 [hydrothermal vent metagenome]|uniref:Uncharacterized protein n=1 Tax=hydrothermal vent metagenome TaxID=652676 RepID=A0A3B0TDA0_9ZZZZ